MVSVIKLRLPPRRRKLLQCPRKPLQGLQHRILRKVSKRQPHMVRVMKRVPRKSIAFKTPNEFVTSHSNTQKENGKNVWGQPPPAVRRPQAGFQYLLPPPIAMANAAAP
jgi:hypothetical protein